MNKFLTGKLKEVSGFNNRPQTADNKTIVQFLPLNGEYESIENNDKLSKVWNNAKDDYRAWWRNRNGFKLGEIRSVQVQSDTEIVSALVYEDKLNLDALKLCLEKIAKHCMMSKNNIHINKFGNKKQWKQVLDYINELLVNKGLTVYIYIGE